METILHARSFSNDDLNISDLKTEENKSMSILETDDKSLSRCKSDTDSYTSEGLQTKDNNSDDTNLQTDPQDTTTEMSSNHSKNDCINMDMCHTETENHNCLENTRSESECCGKEEFSTHNSIAITHSHSDLRLDHNFSESVAETSYIVPDMDMVHTNAPLTTDHHTTEVNAIDSLALDETIHTEPTEVKLNDYEPENKISNNESDLDNATLFEPELNSLEIHNQRQPHNDGDAYGQQMLPNAGSDSVANTVMASNIDIKSSSQNHSGYITSDESGYYSSQIPSECDSNYKNGQLENNGSVLVGANEFMSHPVQLYSLTGSDNFSQDTLPSFVPSASYNMRTSTEYVPSEQCSVYIKDDTKSHSNLDILSCVEDGQVHTDASTYSCPTLADDEQLLLNNSTLQPISSPILNLDHIQTLNTRGETLNIDDSYTPSSEFSSSYIVLDPTSYDTAMPLDTNSPTTNFLCTMGIGAENELNCFNDHEVDFAKGELIVPSSCSRDKTGSYTHEE